MKQQQGVTLIELLISVTIIAIIAAIAFPSYTQYVQRSARAAVQAELMADASKMERLRAQTFSYTGAAAGVASNSTIQQYSPDGTTSASTAKYVISFAVLTGSTYEILAVSTSNFDNKGRTEAMKVNQAGQRCIKALATGVTTCTIGTDPSW